MKRLNKRGFTLSELIVTVAISSIIMIALSSFASVVGRVFTDSKIKNEQQLMLSIIKEYIKKELTLAEDITMTGDLSFEKLSFQNNVILKNDVNAFDDSFYGSQTITADVYGLGSLLYFRITIEKAEKVISEEFVLKTLNKINIDIPNRVTEIYYK